MFFRVYAGNSLRGFYRIGAVTNDIKQKATPDYAGETLPSASSLARWTLRLIVWGLLLMVLVPIGLLAIAAPATRGILWVLFIGAPLALVILGIYGLSRMRRSGNFRLSGYDVAVFIAAISIGVILAPIGSYVVLVAFPIVHSNMGKARQDSIGMSLKHFAISAMLQAEADGAYPTDLYSILQKHKINSDTLRIIRGHFEELDEAVAAAPGKSEKLKAVEELSDITYFGADVPLPHDDDSSLLVAMTKDLLARHQRILIFTDGTVEWVESKDLAMRLAQCNKYRSSLRLTAVMP